MRRMNPSLLRMASSGCKLIFPRMDSSCQRESENSDLRSEERSYCGIPVINAAVESER